MLAERRLGRPRHATVVAYLALFVALGGTAYAANEWTGDNIVDESLTGADILGAAGTAVTPAVNGSITSDDVSGQPADPSNGTLFVDGTLTTSDIKDHSLKRADLAGGLIGNTELSADSVTGAKVLNGSLAGADLAAGSIGAAQLGPDSVGGGNVADGSLGGADLAPGSIGATQLGPDSVGGGNVADGSLGGADLAPGSIGATQLGPNSVAGGNVTDESLGSADIGPSAVGSSEIATDAVGPTEVQDNAIDGGEIVDNSLHDTDLAPNSVTSSELKADAVDSGKIANGSVTLADIKGVDIAGTVNFSAGAVAAGACRDFVLTTTGTKVNEAVLISVKGPLDQGILFYGVRVAVADQTIMKFCNFTGASSPAITSLPIRVVTFS
jgi:trimeric autotransporter adhesin